MADTPPVRKFLFNKPFDDAPTSPRPAGAPPERKPVTLKPEQLDALEKDAYEKGYAEGKRTGLDEQAQQLIGMLDQVQGHMAQLHENISALHASHEVQLRGAILAIAKKLLPDFTSRHGVQEIEALLTSAIGDMLHEPRLVVRVHETQFDDVNTKIHEITVQKAYAGKVVVLADAGVHPGDCRVEWADGGIERNTQG
ncbi:MAG: FliH/SctL family protein, partial [Pseudomonadota bacterium]|nr:FliH/SctL family protein [Pseudomonadota bacterium]